MEWTGIHVLIEITFELCEAQEEGGFYYHELIYYRSYSYAELLCNSIPTVL